MEDLNKLAARARERLVSQATASGSVSKDDLDAVDRLEKLAAGNRSWHQWWIPATAFLIPLCVVTFLIRSEQRETQIELDTTVTAFAATLLNKQPLFEGSLLSAMTATSLEGVDNLSAGDGDCSVDLKLSAKPRPEDAINVQLLEVPAGRRLRVERSERSIDVTFVDPVATADETQTTVSVRGSATIIEVCGGTRTVHEGIPADMSSINLRFGPRTSLSLTPLDGHPLRFVRQVAVEKLALVDEDRYLGSAPSVRQRSSVLSGTLYMNALDGKPVTLRPSEALSFTRFTGTLRSITPAADCLRLQLFATVQGMKTGDDPNEKSLMPTYLQWIAARNELWLWWGSALSGFAFLMSVLRWLKITS
jgi:hypothetical protein